MGTHQHNNYFTPLRLLMAFCVAFEHIFYFSAGEPDSPFELGHTSMAYLAVNAFFIISGFLITKSAERSGSVLTFARSRVLRIIPALAVVSVIIALIVAPLLGGLPAATYYSTASVWAGIIEIITFVDPYPAWPGFEGSTAVFAGDFTGPIWTLRFEALAYVMTGGLLLVGLHREKLVTLVLTLGATALFILDLQTGMLTEMSGTLGSLARFMSCYLYGVCAYQFASYLKLNWIITAAGLIGGAALLAFGIAHGEILLNIALAPLIFGLAYSKAKLPKWLTPQTDYSYGLYIFHWPIYQVLINVFPSAPLFPLLLFAGLPLAFIAAGLSWKLIEKPALKRKTVSAIKLA